MSDLAALSKVDPQKLFECMRCGRQANRFAFRSYKQSGKRVPVCFACEAAEASAYAASKVKIKKLKAPNPCLFCKKPMFFELPPCRVRDRKFCGPECHHSHQQQHERTCEECEQSKPLTEFSRVGKCSRTRRPYCKICQETKVVALGSFDKKRRQSFKNGYQSLIREARRIHKLLQVDEKQARALYAQNCELCAGPAHILLVKQKNRAIKPDNVRVLCLLCHSVSKHIGLPKLLCLALAITAHNGLLPPAQLKRNDHAPHV